jgi:molybdate transport system ATP-binding protein
MTVVLEAKFTTRFSGGPLIEANLRMAADRFGVTVLFGPSGAGKTTVLRGVAGLEKPDNGRIAVGSDVWFDSAARIFVAPQQRDIGFMAQDYALFPHLTVSQNIGYGLSGESRKALTERTKMLVRMLGLAGLEDRMPRHISGGEQQRVALARAVARRPKLLLLDEPLSALDGPTREQLRRELHIWLAQMGVPAIVVTHDLAEALTLGDTLVLMDQGKTCQSGPARQVVAQPATLAVARIVGVDTIEPGTVISAVEGRAGVRVRDTNLWALNPTIRSGEVLVCIRAEDVKLAPTADGALPTDNKLRGIVREVVQDGRLLRVSLDCGFPLCALVTPQAAADLPIRPGETVLALVEAAGVHLIEDCH